MSKRSKPGEGLGDEEIFSSFERVFGSGGIFDNIFGTGRRKPKKQPARAGPPAKKPAPRPLTSKLRLIENGKCPRWADVWIQMLVSVYSTPRMIRPTEEAADAVAMLLEAGWLPPNADSTAFHRWVDSGDASAYITTDEPAEAEEVLNGSQDSQTAEEAPRAD